MTTTGHKQQGTSAPREYLPLRRPRRPLTEITMYIQECMPNNFGGVLGYIINPKAKCRKAVQRLPFHRHLLGVEVPDDDGVVLGAAHNALGARIGDQERRKHAVLRVLVPCPGEARCCAYPGIVPASHPGPHAAQPPTFLIINVKLGPWSLQGYAN